MTVLADPSASSRRLAAAEPATPETWAAAIAADPHPLPEQSPEWMAAICRAGRYRDISRAYRFDDGTSVVVPLVRSSFLSGGSVWSPPPAWGVGGIVGRIDDDVVAAVVADLRALKSVRVSVRIDAIHEGAWQRAAGSSAVVVPRRSHVIDLVESPDEHFPLLSRSTRRNVRISERAGVRVEIDGTGDGLATHYELFMQSVERWAAQQNEPLWMARFRAQRRDPLDKLREMQRALGDRCVTVVGYVDDEPAASAIVLMGPTTRYTRNAMNIDLAGPSKANYAVQWAAITEAYRHGATRYHLGESGTSDSLSDFKERWGAVPVDHHEYRFERVPVTAAVGRLKGAVKRLIGFRD